MQFLGLILLVLFGGVALLALLNAIHLLLPGPVDSARLKLETTLGKSFLLGLVNILFFLVIAAILIWLTQLIRNQSHGIISILAVITATLALAILVTITVFALNGVVALASLFGTRFSETSSPFKRDLFGGILLILACLTPYLGWYIFTPIVICMGLGASVLALFQGKHKVAVE